MNWGKVIESLIVIHARFRTSRRWNEWVLVFQASSAAFNAWLENYWGALFVLLCAWLLYRMYLTALQREALAFSALHHAQRILVEAPERILWHAEQLHDAMERLSEPPWYAP